jgi:hypothetical protein
VASGEGSRRAALLVPRHCKLAGGDQRCAGARRTRDGNDGDTVLPGSREGSTPLPWGPRGRCRLTWTSNEGVTSDLPVPRARRGRRAPRAEWGPCPSTPCGRHGLDAPAGWSLWRRTACSSAHRVAAHKELSARRGSRLGASSGRIVEKSPASCLPATPTSGGYVAGVTLRGPRAQNGRHLGHEAIENSEPP